MPAKSKSASSPKPDAEKDVPSIINTPDQHGFVMAGMQTLFLCHLPMFFMENHCYQVILEASLPDYAMQKYVSDRKSHPNEVYILGDVETDLMTLPQIKTGEVTSFIGDLFRGMPEDHNKDTPLIHNIRVKIERVVYFRHFDFNVDYPHSLTYVLFGAGTEAHLHHVLTKEPDFNHVLDLAEIPSWLPPQQLAAGVHINFPSLPNHPPYCSNPLTKSSYQVQYQGQAPLYPIKLGTSYWFDPSGANATDPCAKPKS
jgi:hypothetical protein